MDIFARDVDAMAEARKLINLLVDGKAAEAEAFVAEQLTSRGGTNVMASTPAPPPVSEAGAITLTLAGMTESKAKTTPARPARAAKAVKDVKDRKAVTDRKAQRKE